MAGKIKKMAKITQLLLSSSIKPRHSCTIGDSKGDSNLGNHEFYKTTNNFVPDHT